VSRDTEQARAFTERYTAGAAWTRRKWPGTMRQKGRLTVQQTEPLATLSVATTDTESPRVQRLCAHLGARGYAAREHIIMWLSSAVVSLRAQL
jgi:hypothetical protein